MSRIQAATGLHRPASSGGLGAGQEILRRGDQDQRRMCRKSARPRTIQTRSCQLAGTLRAGVEMSLGHLDKAREIYKREVAVRDSFSEGLRNSIESRRELAGLYERLAELSLRMNQVEEGRQYYERCAAIRDDVLAERPTLWPVVYDRARSYNNAAFLCFPRGNDPAARACTSPRSPGIDRGSRQAPTQQTSRSSACSPRRSTYEATTALAFGRRQGRGRGLSPRAGDPQGVGERAQGQDVAGRPHARPGALRRTHRGRQDRRDAGRNRRPGTNNSTSSPPAVTLSPPGPCPKSDPALARQYTAKAIECSAQGQGTRLGRRRQPRNRPRPGADPHRPGIPGVPRRVSQPRR